MRELLSAQPALELDTLGNSQSSRKATHGVQSPSVSAYDEFGVHRASRAEQHPNALRSDDPTGEDDAAPRVKSRTRPGGHCGEKGNDPAPGQTVRREVSVNGA